MRYRTTKPADLRTARDFIPAGYGYTPEMREALPRLWEALMHSEQLNTAVVDDLAAPGGGCILGIGLSVFVTDTFADSVLAKPQPYLNARLHEMILAGNSPVLDKRAIAEANSGEGLTLMPLHFCTASFDIRDPAITRVLLAAQDLFRLAHAGFRVKRMLKEVVGTDLCRYMISTGMKLHCDYGTDPAYRHIGNLPEETRPYLLSVNHAELPVGSTLSVMFAPPARRFGFSPAEQKLLRCALLCETDDEIAKELALSLDTLRTQWRSIYERVLTVDPLFFPDDPIIVQNGNARGRGKRRHLLQYVRLYMEELRPYQKTENVLPRERGARIAILRQPPSSAAPSNT